MVTIIMHTQYNYHAHTAYNLLDKRHKEIHVCIYMYRWLSNVNGHACKIDILKIMSKVSINPCCPFDHQELNDDVGAFTEAL